MAKTWYPVIDYSACAECGVCINKCSHAVYNKDKAPTPVVTLPDHCVDHCHGCGNICPNGAITYVGEDSNWTPPNYTNKTEECSCEGSSCCKNKE